MIVTCIINLKMRAVLKIVSKHILIVITALPTEVIGFSTAYSRAIVRVSPTKISTNVTGILEAKLDVAEPYSKFDRKKR